MDKQDIYRRSLACERVCADYIPEIQSLEKSVGGAVKRLMRQEEYVSFLLTWVGRIGQDGVTVSEVLDVIAYHPDTPPQFMDVILYNIKNIKKRKGSRECQS